MFLIKHRRIEVSETRPLPENYNLTNPPPNIGEAYVRLMSLEESVEHIAAQLEFADSEEYPDDETYLSWKARAITALSYQRAEIKFLERWISIQEFAHFYKDAERKEDSLLQLDAIARRLLAEMAASYQTVYNASVLPENYDAALARRDALNGLSQRFHSYFQSMYLLGEMAGVREAEVKNLIGPMVLISKKTAAEVSLLRKYLRSSSPGVNRIQLLLDVVDRVIQIGHTLTPDELTSVEEVKSYMASRDN